MTNVCIIGCGEIVNHYRGFNSSILIEADLHVTALIDTNLEKAKLAALAFNQPLVSTRLDDSIFSVADAFVIATPNHLHYSYGKACLEASKHVLMEKPLATTRGECEELIAISQRNGAVLMVGLCMRFHPLILRFKKLLDEKFCGEIFQLSIWTEQYTEYESTHWHVLKKTMGGGQLFSHGCHYIDLLIWLMGNPVEGFFLGTNKGTPWMEEEGISNGCLKFPNGSLGYYFGTWGARGTRNGYLIQAHCTNGMIEIDFNKSIIKMYSKGTHEDVKNFYTGTTKETILYDQPIDFNDVYQNEMLHFIQSINQKTLPITNATTSLKSLNTIWQLYEKGFLENY